MKRMSKEELEKKNWVVKAKSSLFLQPREQQNMIDTHFATANLYFTLTALILHS